MTSARRSAVAADPRSGTTGNGARTGSLNGSVAGDLRQMALHLETAVLLERRAHRASDPVKIAVLRRRAEQRRREAARIRERLAAQGVVLSRAGRGVPGREGPH